MLPCHGECNIPEGYLEEQRRLIEGLRQDFIERIQHRARVWLQIEVPPEECEAMFEEQILNAGMEYAEAQQVLHQMHDRTMTRQARRERETKI